MHLLFAFLTVLVKITCGVQFAFLTVLIKRTRGVQFQTLKNHPYLKNHQKNLQCVFCQPHARVLFFVWIENPFNFI